MLIKNENLYLISKGKYLYECIIYTSKKSCSFFLQTFLSMN